MVAPITNAAPVAPAVVAERSRSAQFALAFLLGIVAALLGMKLWEGRQTKPLDTALTSYSYRLDLNHATANEIAQLPRVGPAMANRIVEARPFASADDLNRVSGFGPATRDKVLPHVTVNPDSASTVASGMKSTKSDQPVDPNTGSLEELMTLPSIGPKMAQRIIDERAKRPFANVDDLRRVSGIGPKTLEKLRGRIVFRTASDN